LYDVEAVAELARQPVPQYTKGFVADRTPADLAAAGVTVFDGDFTFPLLTVRREAVDNNVAVMGRFCADLGVRLAPHAKTAMSPQLFARQLDAGAWGLTAATIDQVRVYRGFGVRRILLANELVDPAAIAWVRRERGTDPGFEFLCYVDSVEGVALLDGSGLDVLVELGHPGGRTGCRSIAEALEVAGRVEASGSLRLAGVSGYEGSIGAERTPEVLAKVERFCGDLLRLARAVPTRVLTAGGSVFPDVVGKVLSTADSAEVLLRCGSYVVHDDGMYQRLSPLPLKPALEVWAQVLSRPERDLALLGLGRRDVGFDQGLPVPTRVRTRDGATRPADGLEVTGLNDHHCFVSGPAPAPGEHIALGISHPCTTLDRWRLAPMIDETGRVTEIIHTYF
jgi:D-serine deaminase-like pyridoxal phosphate-dependent protein